MRVNNKTMKYVIYFLLLFFCNCKKKVSSERTLKAISFFNLKQNTLIENEPFRLILCSSAGTKKADSDHLIQFIAIKHSKLLLFYYLIVFAQIQNNK